MAALSDKYRTYALDFWGFGDSAKERVGYTISDYVTLIENFVQYLGLRDIIIVGHGLGAIVMLEYAARQPEHVKKLVAVSMLLQAQGVDERLLGLAYHPLLAKFANWRQPLHYPEVQAELEKADRAAVQESLRSITPDKLSDQMQSLSERPQLRFLLIYGGKDHLVDPTPARQMNGHRPNVRAIGLAEATHFPMLDEPTKFQRLLKDFLELEDDLSALSIKEEWHRRMR
jgi:pimeloyl-ACP methyl ester carboxylesterase